MASPVSATITNGVFGAVPVGWFIDNRPHLRDHISHRKREGDAGKRLLAIVGRERIKRVLKPMLDEGEFLSP